MNLLQLRHLEVFIAIVRAGSITEAARMLNVTQPAVSAALKHAEARLGFRLFDRVGGRLRPSPEGQAMLPDVIKLFDRASVIDRLARDLSGGTLGALSIAAAFPVSNGYVAEAVATFLQERSEMKVSLHSMTSGEVIDRVLNQEVEVGIAHEPIESAAVERERLSQMTIACIVGKDHPLAGRAQVSIPELAEYKLITYLPHSVLRPYIDAALGKFGVVPQFQVQVTVSSTALQLAHFGAGVALVESFLLDSTPTRWNLVVVPLVPQIVLDTSVLTNRAVPRSDATIAFIEHLKRTAASPRYR